MMEIIRVWSIEAKMEDKTPGCQDVLFTVGNIIACVCECGAAYGESRYQQVLRSRSQGLCI